MRDISIDNDSLFYIAQPVFEPVIHITFDPKLLGFKD